MRVAADAPATEPPPRLAACSLSLLQGENNDDFTNKLLNAAHP